MQSLIIQVNRSNRPIYSAFVRVRHSHFELHGPETYDLLTDVEEWFHPHLEYYDSVSGFETFLELEEKGLLGDCLNLQDANAIRALGPSVFLEHFGNKKIVFPKSTIVDRREKRLEMPFLFYWKGSVALRWNSLDDSLDKANPILKFKKSVHSPLGGLIQ